jgi:hypothetical protein
MPLRRPGKTLGRHRTRPAGHWYHINGCDHCRKERPEVRREPFFRGALYELLSNPIYIGAIRHRGIRHPGLHEPIVNRELWDKTQLLLRSHAVRRASRRIRSSASPLTGQLFDESGGHEGRRHQPKP